MLSLIIRIRPESGGRVELLDFRPLAADYAGALPVIASLVLAFVRTPFEPALALRVVSRIGSREVAGQPHRQTRHRIAFGPLLTEKDGWIDSIESAS